MLEKDLTTYQSLDNLQQREYLQRLINLLNTSQHACGSIDYLIKKEETFCKEKSIKLPSTYPDNQPS